MSKPPSLFYFSKSSGLQISRKVGSFRRQKPEANVYPRIGTDNYSTSDVGARLRAKRLIASEQSGEVFRKLFETPTATSEI